MIEENIEDSFQAAINAEKINGAIICASNARGTFEYNKALGTRTLLSKEIVPSQLDDIVFLASATKLITTIAALQCVDDGLLSLTGDLFSVAPELARKEVLKGFSEDGTPLLESQTSRITLQMLLTHSAGTTYHFTDPLIAKWRENFSPAARDPSTDAAFRVEELFTYPLSYQPGSSWMYGCGIDWAGRIVERVTNQSLCDRMHERIFSPLGIIDAEFYPVANEKLRARMVDLNPDDPLALGRAVLGGGGETNKRTRGDFGGHGLFMTAVGFVTVLKSLLRDDGKILKSQTVSEMFENHLGQRATEGLEAALSGHMGDFFRVGTATNNKAGYGLGGLLTLQDVQGWYGDRTLTWGGGWTLAWFIDRQNDLCGVGAIQARNPADAQAVTSLKQVFRRDVYRKKSMWTSDGNK